MVDRVSALTGSAAKAHGSFDRQVSTETTLAVAHALRERYGITRIADTTRLDRIGMPTISSIVPDSPDRLGVYNGKGLTRDAALAGALMEAIERQICSRFESMYVFDAPVRVVDRILDLRSLGWLGEIDEAPVPCVRGVNLIDDSKIDVPVGVVRSPRVGNRLFNRTSTNGLASGNTAIEAVYHAVMELIERHMWSKAHILAHIWPRRLRAGAGVEVEAPDDPVAADVLGADDHPLLNEPIRRIRDAGLRFRLLTYTEPGWPHAMMACIADPAGHELFYHLGFGCSWSPVHAAIRAVTESVQVRVTDIQGAREDIKRADQAEIHGIDHGRRPKDFPLEGRWYYEGPARSANLAELLDHSDPDLSRDLERALETLRDWGETCVAYVDLTPPDVPISVARVVAPHLERTLVDGTISARMQAFMKNPLLR